MSSSPSEPAMLDVEDKTATLTLDGAAEADQWLRDNGIKGNSISSPLIPFPITFDVWHFLGVLPPDGGLLSSSAKAAAAAAEEAVAEIQDPSSAGQPSRPPRRRERKKSSPPSPKLTSNGLPPTPKVHMGACFSKVFNGCPLGIHGTVMTVATFCLFTFEIDCSLRFGRPLGFIRRHVTSTF